MVEITITTELIIFVIIMFFILEGGSLIFKTIHSIITYYIYRKLIYYEKNPEILKKIIKKSRKNYRVFKKRYYN